MAYRLKRKESLAKAVRRLARERIEHTIECLHRADQPAAAIHGARKNIKKTRALFRLMCPGIAKKESRWLKRRLREIAALLAPSRDAYIKSQTVRKLADHFQRQRMPGTLRHLRAALRKSCAEEIGRLEKANSRRQVRRRLQQVAKRLKQLKVDRKGWRVLGPGVKSAYRSSRGAGRAVLRDPSDENFHEWRKRGKDLWYQMRLLHSLWPEQMDAMANDLKTLSEKLGDDHDLVILKQDLDERFVRGGNAPEWEMIYGLIETRQRELRASALAIGQRFYAEKLSAFCERLGRYWEIWRGEKKRRVLSGPAAA